MKEREITYISLPTLNTKLSEILDFLPHGLVDKKITGIGATHLEMYCPRNSIIVTPTRALAYNKSLKDSHFLYIGSPYNGKASSSQDIKDYLNNTSVEHKKFLVVADSLPRLIHILEEKKAIQQENTGGYEEYFLMVDEIDTLQSDNYFRPVLSKVIDYYLKFNPLCRALVSATVKSFSHPELRKETLNLIVCKESLKRDIKLIQSNNINQAVTNMIINIIKDCPDDKILIAYNSVRNILEIIKLLPFEIQESCGILCSENNRIEIGGYEAKINEKDRLSHKITFMTCAYFSGIDIADKCHLITVSNITKAYSVLPLSRMIQIHGRCRNGILSDTIIYNYKKKDLNYTVDEYYNLLIEKANKVITLLEKAEELQKNDSNITNLFSRIRKLIIEKASGNDDNLFGESSVPLTRENIGKKPEISYFNIDALCEKMKAYVTLYSDWEGLFNQLKEVHDVAFERLYIDTSEEQKGARKHVKEDIKDKNKKSILKLKDKLINLINENKLDEKELSRLIYLSKGKGTDYLWKVKKHYRYIDSLFLAEELYPVCQKNKKSYRGFKNALSFWVLDDKHPFKLQVLNSFEIGVKYTKEDIKEILLPIVRYHFFKVNVSQSRLTNFFNNVFKKTYTDGGKYKVKGLNPRKVPKPISKIPADVDNLQSYFEI